MIDNNKALSRKNIFFWLERISLLVFLLSPVSPENLSLQIKVTFPNQKLEINYRGFYRIRNGKPRLVGQPRTFSKNRLSFVYPFQSHEMKNLDSAKTPAITLNIHCPARKD